MRKGRRLSLLAAFLLVGVPLTGGCQSVSSYFQDRVLDFVDIWGFKICAGKGIKMGAEIGNSFLATEYEDFFFAGVLRRHIIPPNPVFGYYDFEDFGFQGRAAGIWRDKGIDLFGPVDRKLRAVAGNDYLYESVDEFNEWYRKTPERSNVPLDYRQPKYHYDTDIHIFLPILPLVTVLEFDFSPWQLADFILGWFHIDICKDDAWNRFYNEEEDVQPAPQPAPRKQDRPSTVDTASRN